MENRWKWRCQDVAYTPTYSFSAIHYNLSVFELLTFGHPEKIAIGFGTSWCKEAEGDRYGWKIAEQMAMQPQSIAAVRTLDSASNAEIAGVAASASKRAEEAADKISWEQDLFAQTLTNYVHHGVFVYIITNMLSFPSVLVVFSQNFLSQLLF